MHTYILSFLLAIGCGLSHLRAVRGAMPGDGATPGVRKRPAAKGRQGAEPKSSPDKTQSGTKRKTRTKRRPEGKASKAKSNRDEINAFDLPPDDDQSSITRAFGHDDGVTPKQRFTRAKSKAKAKACKPKRKARSNKKTKALDTNPEGGQAENETVPSADCEPMPKKKSERTTSLSRVKNTMEVR